MTMQHGGQGDGEVHVHAVARVAMRLRSCLPVWQPLVVPAGCSRLSLRFADVSKEACFARDRRAQLRASTIFQCKGIGTCAALLVLNQTVVSRWHVRETFPTDIAHRCHLVTICGLGVYALMHFWLWMVVRTRWLAECRAHLLEAILVCVHIGGLVAPFFSPTLVAELLGVDWRAEFGEGAIYTDSTRLLAMTSVIAVSHFAAKVRWAALFPVEIVCILTYAVVVFFLGGSEGPVIGRANLAFLTVIVSLLAAGKRAGEVDERFVFLRSIEERSLRYEAEFRLSALESRPAGPRGGEQASESQSQLTSTAASGSIFDGLFDGEGDLTSKLERVRELGAKEHWIVDQSKVQVLENRVLGEGGYGKVFVGIFCGMVVAVKAMRITLSEAKPRDIGAWCNELRILRRLRHPNIVAFHGAVIDAQKQLIHLVLEHVRGITLKDFVMGKPQEAGAIRPTQPTASARFQIMLGVCRALLYLHGATPPIVHGDLKGSNVMVEVLDNSAVHPRLLDFGLSRVLVRGVRQLGGTLPWMAPEVVQHTGKVKCSADVYSFGRMVVYVSIGTPPFQYCGRNEVRRSLLAGDAQLRTWPDDCPFKPTCEPLAEACLQRLEAERPSISHVHEVLLTVPERAGLASDGSHLEDLRVLAAAAAQRCQPDAPGGEVDEPRAPAELPPLPEGQQAELPPLPEGQQALARPHGTCWKTWPDLRATNDSAKGASLMALARSWNVKLKQPPCCEFHGAMSAIRSVVVPMMEAAECEPRPQGEAPLQCHACGIMGVRRDRGGACTVCGESEGAVGSAADPVRMAL